MKNKEKLLKYLPIALFMMIMVVLHFNYVCQYDDLALINDTLKPTIMEEFYSVIYNFTSWSSRVLVNLPIHIMLHLPYGVWMVLHNIMWLAIIVSLIYIFDDKKQVEKRPLLVLLLLLFPFYMEMAAGWVVTTMTYVWPFAAGTVALTALRRWLDGKQNKWYHYVLYSLLVIYGANQEQMCVFLCMVLGSCTLYSLIQKKRNGVLYTETFFAVANLLLHMLTPGNENRNLISTAAYFPSYGTLSIMDKLEIGFSGTLYTYMFENPKFLFVFTFMLLCVVWQKRTSWVHRILGAMPFFIHGFFGYFMGWLLQTHLHIYVFAGHLTSTGVITEYNYFDWKRYIPMAIMFAFGIFLMIALYLAFGDCFKSIFAILMLFGGLAARMIVALSSSVWESGNRTYMIFEYALIMLSMLLLGELDVKKNKKLYMLLCVVLVLFATASLVFTFRTV